MKMPRNLMPPTSPARYKAEEMGIDLKEIEGTGSGRLITVSDVLRKDRSLNLWTGNG